MKKKHTGKLFQFDRGALNDGGFTNGYVLDFSNDWTFLQFVDRDIFLDGYSVIRKDTIKKYRRLTDDNSMVHRALRALGEFPQSPGNLDLTDINSIAQSANQLFPLIVIHREIRWKDSCDIGGVATVSPKTITIEAIDPGAGYGGAYRIRSADITMIGFDGRYERALWAVASQRTKRRITKRCATSAGAAEVR